MFPLVTPFVSFGVNALNSTTGNVERIAPSVGEAAKENMQWVVWTRGCLCRRVDCAICF